MWDIRQARRGEFITAEADNIYSVFHLKYMDHGRIVDDARIDLLTGAYEFNPHNDFADLKDEMLRDRISYRPATAEEADLLKDAGRKAAFIYTDEHGFGTLRSDLGPDPYIPGIMDDRLSLLLNAGLVDWTLPDK
jgi:hypothetical protein